MKRLLLVLAALVAFAGGIGVGIWLRADVVTLETGTLLDPPRAVAPMALDTTHGDADPLGDDRWSLLFFGFTRCPDICPNTLTILSDAQQRIDEADVTPPRIVLISVDPDYDTVDRLADYVAYFGTDVVGATGTEAAIAAVARDLGIVYRRVPLDDDDYTMDHTSAVLLIDPARQLRAVFSPPLRGDTLASDLIAALSLTKDL